MIRITGNPNRRINGVVGQIAFDEKNFVYYKQMVSPRGNLWRTFKIPLNGVTLTSFGSPAEFLSGDGVYKIPSPRITQVEVDFGVTPIKSRKFIFIDANVTALHKVMATVSYDAPTGGSGDDAGRFENLHVMARAGAGRVFVFCSSPFIDLTGKVKINYIAG